MRIQAHAVSNPYYFLQHIKAGAVVEGPGRIVFTHDGRLCLSVKIGRRPNGTYSMVYQLVDKGYYLHPHGVGGATIRTLLDMLPGLVERQLSQA